jgi:uncharacterized FlaG/YvyC family protein
VSFQKTGKLKLSPEQQRSLQKINTFIDSVNTKVGSLCDAECMRDRERESLWTKYEKAKTTLETAPSDLEKAQRDYFVFTKGSAWYESEQRKKAQDKAEKIAKELKSQMASLDEDVSARLDEYQTAVKYIDNVEAAISENERILSEKTEQLDNATNDENIAGRRLYYEQADTGWASTITNVLGYATWMIFIGGLLFYYLYLGHYGDLFTSLRSAGMSLGAIVIMVLTILYLPGILFSLLVSIFPNIFA